MTDKEILYQMLEREIRNILNIINPTLSVFSGTATKYDINYIDPYVDAFMDDGSNIQTAAASEFVKQEVNDKIKDFITKFNSEKQMNNDL